MILLVLNDRSPFSATIIVSYYYGCWLSSQFEQPFVGELKGTSRTSLENDSRAMEPQSHGLKGASKEAIPGEGVSVVHGGA